jgi:hypothetical protein
MTRHWIAGEHKWLAIATGEGTTIAAESSDTPSDLIVFYRRSSAFRPLDFLRASAILRVIAVLDPSSSTCSE